MVAEPLNARNAARSSLRWLPRIFRYAWASPGTLLGLALVIVVLLRGGKALAHRGIVEAFLPPTAGSRRIPFDAITLGHVIVGRDERALDHLRAHEHVHVHQFEQWGPALLIAYPASSLMQLLCGRDPYQDNYFEIQARTRSQLPPDSTP